MGNDSFAASNAQEPDQAPPTGPFWETAVVQFPTLRRQIKHFQQHPSGRRQLWIFQHSEPDRAPPTAPLWETTIVELPALRGLVKPLQQHPAGRRQLRNFRAPKAGWTTSNSTPLGEDSCTLLEHPRPDRPPPTASLRETTIKHF